MRWPRPGPWPAILVGIVLALPVAGAPARAQEDAGLLQSGGVYLTVGGSLGAVNDPRTTDDFEVDLGAEFGLFVGLGYELGPFRVEGQLLSEAFQVNNLNRGATTSLPPGDYVGSLSSIGLMANAFVEIGGSESAQPYLGIGGGVAFMTPDYRDNSCFFLFCSTGDSAADGSDRVAAWQGMAGITVPSQRFGGEWDFGYRYFATNRVDFRLVDGTPFTQDGTRSHSVQIGYRHHFGGAGGSTPGTG